MLFEQDLMFLKIAGTNSFTAGEYVSLAGVATTFSTVSLGNARDLGIFDGMNRPRIAVVVGNQFVSGVATASYNFQLMGSTNGILAGATTYSETGVMTSASLTSGSILEMEIPPRPPGAALPLYYLLNIATVVPNAQTITAGSLVAGIVLSTPQSSRTMANYAAGFTVA
jgi:hypothetical protein